jgi:hypothetical protein
MTHIICSRYGFYTRVFADGYERLRSQLKRLAGHRHKSNAKREPVYVV